MINPLKGIKMNNPIRPKFSFLANSDAPDDKSGVATWEFSISVRGEWVIETRSCEFNSFADAFAVNQIIDSAWTAGEAVGYHNAKTAVLGVLI